MKSLSFNESQFMPAARQNLPAYRPVPPNAQWEVQCWQPEKAKKAGERPKSNYNTFQESVKATLFKAVRFFRQQNNRYAFF